MKINALESPGPIVFLLIEPKLRRLELALCRSTTLRRRWSQIYPGLCKSEFQYDEELHGLPTSLATAISVARLVFAIGARVHRVGNHRWSIAHSTDWFYWTSVR